MKIHHSKDIIKHSYFICRMKPELMAPASDRISLRAAIDAGADAVYLGVKELNMRITSKNFSSDELEEVVGLCHEKGVKTYLTLNTIIYEEELESMRRIVKKARDAKVDAVICWDMSVVSEAKKEGLPVFLSTQASVSNSRSAEFYKELGVSRIVLARECKLEDIRMIKDKTGIEIEIFIHGAMCVSVSGRCFISQYLFNKSANRGDCLQPCRRSYIIKDPEEGHELELGKDYVLSPKDLCTMMFIDKLMDAGADSLKIEGRARSPEYVKTVTSAYREAIDLHSEGKLTREKKEKLLQELKTVFNRGFSEGFYMQRPISDWTDAYGSKATTRKEYAGIVANFYKDISVAEIKLQSSGLKKGDQIMIQGETTGIVEQEAGSMQKDHKEIDSADKGESIGLKMDKLVRINDKVYKIIPA